MLGEEMEASMKATVYQKLLRHLALASISLTSGAGMASAALGEIPVDVASDLIDEIDENDRAGWNVHDRIGALTLLTHDPRPVVRARVARSARTLWDSAPDEALQLVRQLLQDPEPEVALAAGSALEHLIDRASPARRIEIVCDLTVSAEEPERIAIARALSRPTPLFVTDIAITELSRDTNPEVRALALSAAERHFREAPGEYRALGLVGAADSDAGVRAAARRLLGSRRGDGAAGSGVT
jgi:hypothetical protein